MDELTKQSTIAFTDKTRERKRTKIYCVATESSCGIIARLSLGHTQKGEVHSIGHRAICDSYQLLL